MNLKTLIIFLSAIIFLAINVNYYLEGAVAELSEVVKVITETSERIY